MMKSIVIYYSYTNNTKNLALWIKEKLNCDIFELVAKEKYPSDYDEVVSLGQYEVDHNVRRECKEVPDISDYDRVIVLTPTWWYKSAPIVTTFLKDTDFSSKIVIPVMTNAGWPGTVISDMTMIALKNGAKVEHPLEVKFDKDVMVTTEETLNDWIAEL